MRPIPSTSRWVALGLGLNNFGTGRVRMSDLADRLAEDSDLRLVGWFGGTGNLGIDADLSSGEEIADRLYQATCFRWAVIRLLEVEGIVAEIGGTPLPQAVVGVRWTRGLALLVVAPTSIILTDTDRAHLRWTSDRRAVAVVKRDLVDEEGRLDRERRLGGWGAISAEIRRQVGGDWTARSLRVVNRLLETVSS